MEFAVATAALLAVYNNATNSLPALDRFYVPLNVASAVLLVAAGSGAGLTGAAMGFTVDPRGPTAAIAFLAVAAAMLAVGLFLHTTAHLYGDRRVAHLTPRTLAYVTLIRIPLGTALLEEVAFRGVLLAAVDRQTSTPTAVLVSSAIFGLWHIAPTARALDLNRLRSHRVLIVAASVVATGLVGALFCALRIRTGGLFAPIAVHAGINAMATAAAFVAQRAPSLPSRTPGRRWTHPAARRRRAA